MAKSIEEIQEGMADFEGRLLYLENLHTLSDSSRETPLAPEVIEDKPSSITSQIRNLRKQIEQLENWRLYFQGKFNEHLDKKKKRGSYF